jgi:hypothetical protein
MNIDPSVVAVAVLTPLGIHLANRWVARASLRRSAQVESLPATFGVAPFYRRLVLIQLIAWLSVGALVAVFIRPGGPYVGAFIAAFAGLPALFLRQLRSTTLTISDHSVQYRDTSTAWHIDRASIKAVFTTSDHIVIDIGAPRRAVMPVYIDHGSTVLRLLRQSQPNQMPEPTSGLPPGRGSS